MTNKEYLVDGEAFCPIQKMNATGNTPRAANANAANASLRLSISICIITFLE